MREGESPKMEGARQDEALVVSIFRSSTHFHFSPSFSQNAVLHPSGFFAFFSSFTKATMNNAPGAGPYFVRVVDCGNHGGGGGGGGGRRGSGGHSGHRGGYRVYRVVSVLHFHLNGA